MMGLTDAEQQEWNVQHVPHYLQGLLFLRKCSKRLYSLHDRMMPESGAAFVEVTQTTGEEQTALLIEKEAYKSARKFREQFPDQFDPEQGWWGMLPQLDFNGEFKLTCDLNKDAYSSIVYHQLRRLVR